MDSTHGSLGAVRPARGASAVLHPTARTTPTNTCPRTDVCSRRQSIRASKDGRLRADGGFSTRCARTIAWPSRNAARVVLDVERHRAALAATKPPERHGVPANYRLDASSLETATAPTAIETVVSGRRNSLTQTENFGASRAGSGARSVTVEIEKEARAFA